ncbi:MAG: hypothetical protein ACI857_003339 [Arenicella sp.]|jgi:hypothetical protein
MAENTFTNKMKLKDIQELKDVIEGEGFVQEAKEAARIELESRGEKIEIVTEDKKPNSEEPTGEDKYLELRKSIKKKRSFSFTPKAEISFYSREKQTAIHALCLKTIEELQWDRIHIEDLLIEIRRKRKKNFASLQDENNWTHDISISFDQGGKITVKSKSLGSESFDMGRNNEGVQLFKLVFEKMASETKAAELKTIESDYKAQQSWDNYEIPDQLPIVDLIDSPSKLKFYVFGIIGVTLLAFLSSYLLSKIYFILVTELILGLAISYILIFAVEQSNFTHFQQSKRLIIYSSIGFLLFHEISGYIYFTNENPIFNLTMIEYFTYKFETGLVYKDLKLGPISYGAKLFLMPFFIYYVCMFTFPIKFILFLTNRVPEEVSDFVLYHFIQGKDEDGVKRELAKKEWTNPVMQDYAIQAGVSKIDQHELARNI